MESERWDWRGIPQPTKRFGSVMSCTHQWDLSWNVHSERFLRIRTSDFGRTCDSITQFAGIGIWKNYSMEFRRFKSVNLYIFKVALILRQSAFSCKRVMLPVCYVIILHWKSKLILNVIIAELSAADYVSRQRVSSWTQSVSDFDLLNNYPFSYYT